MQKALRSVALVWVVALLVIGCRDDHGVDAAVQRAAPHLDAFVRFARWARQTSQSDVALRSDAALREATFAPLRANKSVLSARVLGRVRGRAIDLVFLEPERVPPAQDFVSVRSAELGIVQVATSEDCVVLRTVPKAGDTLAVEVAFTSRAP